MGLRAENLNLCIYTCSFSKKSFKLPIKIHMNLNILFEADDISGHLNPTITNIFNNYVVKLKSTQSGIFGSLIKTVGCAEGTNFLWPLQMK